MASVISALGSVLGGNIADGIADIIKLFKVDPNLALQQQEKLAEIQATLQEKILDSVTAQVNVNAEEAKSTNLFVAGWRPGCGWTCSAAFAYAFVIQPIITTILVAHNPHFDKNLLPTLDLGSMMPVLLGMLGLGSLRTYEKSQGISDSAPHK